MTFVISSLRLGGAEGVCARLADALDRRGDAVSIVTLADRASDAYTLPAGVRRIALDLEGESGGPWGGLRANLARVRALRRALAGLPPGPVVALLAVTNVLTVLASIGLGRRVVVSERNDPARQSLGRLWDALRRWTYPRAGLVTVNNPAALSTVRDWGVRAAAMVDNPPPAPPATAARPADSRILLHIGRLTAQKAQDVLLRAFARVAAARPDWRLVVIGEGEDEAALKRLAGELDLSGRIDWIGKTAAVGEQYEAAALFVLPSRYEGTPNALLEAMAAGLPVVVSDGIGGGLDHVRAGENGLVVPVDDEAALADALAGLMDDPAARVRLGAAGRAGMLAARDTAIPPAWDAAFGFR